MGTQIVLPGIDALLESGRYRKAKLGLITNPSGVTMSGAPAWKALVNNGFSLVSLFGPEHGLRGEAQDAVQLGDETFSGIKTYSLYGEHLRPTEEMLADLEVMVYDIQDVGSRYYTYLYTLAYSLEECARLGKTFVVLDRPNPIGAAEVEGGPIPEESWSFVGSYALANRHGFTVGEYARYLQGQYVPEADLEVVWMKGYQRRMLFADTHLPWTTPSPNLPSLPSALLYPGTCLFEGTSLSEGRGTTRPFENIGAPWLDGEGLREKLGELDLPGVIFCSTFFTPQFSKHKGQSCSGVLLHVTDASAFKPLYTALAMLWIIKKEHADRLEWRPDWEGSFSFLDRLAGGRYLRDMLDAGKSLDEIYERACQGHKEYIGIRDKYLHYR